jgi:hypothetical protein
MCFSGTLISLHFIGALYSLHFSWIILKPLSVPRPFTVDVCTDFMCPTCIYKDIDSPFFSRSPPPPLCSTMETSPLLIAPLRSRALVYTIPPPEAATLTDDRSTTCPAEVTSPIDSDVAWPPNSKFRAARTQTNK